MRTLKYKLKFLLVTVTCVLTVGNYKSFSMDYFQYIYNLEQKGCKVSKILKINSVESSFIILGDRKIPKGKIMKVYGTLSEGNYAVAAECNEGIVLIVFQGGKNGPSIY